MDELFWDIIEHLRLTGAVDDHAVGQIIRNHNQGYHEPKRKFAKKQLMPYFLRVRDEAGDRWRAWNLSDAEERAIRSAIQMKPRRTASGVATITVITKPWPCGNACLYCPNDLRMPKSYLSNEPACQRAERAFFDPYLQVASRMRALTGMGHPTDKVELIVLGGTWTDYPHAYRLWFIRELFRALNDGVSADEVEQRRAFYRSVGVENDPAALASFVAEQQGSILRGESGYNQAFHRLYDAHEGWLAAAEMQAADWASVEAEHARNETADHRCVGLVVETRPDTVTAPMLTELRRLGCTKVQIGIQSLDEDVLRANNRVCTVDQLQRAFELIRLLGFKVHTHLMANLYGSNPERDKREFDRFVSDPRFLPDEVKLYPCALVDGTGLMGKYRDGSWRPYTHDELLDVLCHDVLATPPYTRISRMIRDISAEDIVAGNKMTNLRQMVEGSIQETGQGDDVQDIRFREVGTREFSGDGLVLDEVAYETTATNERFLQWVTPEGKIAGFLRLSLPHADYVDALSDELPIGAGQAMIREVHVYGKVAKLHDTSQGAQHLGLGRQLIERACCIASEAGYSSINVISAVGTREYYRNLGFADAGLYLRKPLVER